MRDCLVVSVHDASRFPPPFVLLAVVVASDACQQVPLGANSTTVNEYPCLSLLRRPLIPRPRRRKGAPERVAVPVHDNLMLLKRPLQRRLDCTCDLRRDCFDIQTDFIVFQTHPGENRVAPVESAYHVRLKVDLEAERDAWNERIGDEQSLAEDR